MKATSMGAGPIDFNTSSPAYGPMMSQYLYTDLEVSVYAERGSIMQATFTEKGFKA